MPLVLATETNPGIAQWVDSSIISGLSGPVQVIGVSESGPNPAAIYVPAPSSATGSVTLTAPLSFAGPDTITIGNFAPLTANNGPRTSGGNDFDASLGTVALQRQNIIQALNDPANVWQGDIVAYLGPNPGEIIIESKNAGFGGNSITLATNTGNVTLSGPALTGGGVPNPKVIEFDAADVDLLLQQLFILSVGFEGRSFDIALFVTNISVDGGPNLVTGLLPVPVVSAATPFSSPDWSIPLPAGSKVSITLENIAPRPTLVIPTWTASTSTASPVGRTALGLAAFVSVPQGTPATATLTVAVPGAIADGDVILFESLEGEPEALTAYTGAVLADQMLFDISSGTALGIAAALAATAPSPLGAINNNNDLNDIGFSATDNGDGSITIQGDAGQFANTAFTVQPVVASPGSITVTPFSGGTDGTASLVFPAAPADLILEQLFLVGAGGEGIDFTGALTVNSISIDGGPNLIDGQLSGSMIAASGVGESPRLDIPIATGQVVTVVVENPASNLAAVAAWITRPQ